MSTDLMSLSNALAATVASVCGCRGPCRPTIAAGASRSGRTLSLTTGDGV